VKYVEDNCCATTKYVRPTRVIRGEVEVKERGIERPESRILMLTHDALDVSAFQLVCQATLSKHRSKDARPVLVEAPWFNGLPAVFAFSIWEARRRHTKSAMLMTAEG
jgi:hypothetical protein